MKLPLAMLLAAAAWSQPLRLHPDNPHYFLFAGRPTVLITSGEHYGAVLNRDFDYVRYLDTLRADRLNLTRTFSGSYREVGGNFGIVSNTLAPAAGKFAGPVGATRWQVRSHRLGRRVFHAPEGLRGAGREARRHRRVGALLPAVPGQHVGCEPDERAQ